MNPLIDDTQAPSWEFLKTSVKGKKGMQPGKSVSGQFYLSCLRARFHIAAEKVVALKGRGFSRAVNTSFAVRLWPPREPFPATSAFFRTLFSRAVNGAARTAASAAEVGFLKFGPLPRIPAHVQHQLRTRGKFPPQKPLPAGGLSVTPPLIRCQHRLE
jgi:hypothetical protein